MFVYRTVGEEEEGQHNAMSSLFSTSFETERNNDGTPEFYMENFSLRDEQHNLCDIRDFSRKDLFISGNKVVSADNAGAVIQIVENITMIGWSFDFQGKHNLALRVNTTSQAWFKLGNPSTAYAPCFVSVSRLWVVCTALCSVWPEEEWEAQLSERPEEVISKLTLRVISQLGLKFKITRCVCVCVHMTLICY
jgi:hypothetical protein